MSLVSIGDFTEYDNLLIALDATGGTKPTDVSIAYDVKGAKEITVFVSNGNSANLDVNCYGDVGLGYSTVPISLGNLGATSKDMILCLTGFYNLKVELVNKDSSATVVSYRVVVRK